MACFKRAVIYLSISAFCGPFSAPLFGGDNPNADDIKKFQRELQKQMEAPPAQNDPLDSFAYEFVSKVWSEPKYRYLAGSIVAGESILAAMLAKRASLNVKTWQRQIDTVKEVSRDLREATSKLGSAERDLLKSLANLQQADRAELLKTLNDGKSPLKPSLEKALKAPPPSASPSNALSLEQAAANLESAYSRWQVQAAAEAKVLRASGAIVNNPVTLVEMTAEVEQRLRAVTRLQFTSGEFSTFKNAGLKHLADQAKLGLGKGFTWRAKVWRKTRIGLLLAAIPVIAVGVTLYYDRELEKNRRAEDLNQAVAEDRAKSLTTLIPYFHRPLLFSFVRAWNKVAVRNDSPLKRFRCPVELKEIEEENPDLTIMQALSLQVLIDMEAANEDIVEESGKKVPQITVIFFKRLVRKLLDHQKSGLLQLKPNVLDDVIADLAFEAHRAFDKTDD